MNPNEIISTVRDGDPRTLKRLYKYFPVVKKWLIANGCANSDTEDIYQEALIVFCNKCQNKEFELSSSFDTYILSVSKYVFYNQTRKKRPELGELSSLDIAASNDLDELKEKESKLDYCFQALSKISKKCKDMLELFYLQKKSMKELAKRFGFANEKVAKAQKYRCLSYAKEYALKLIN